MSASVHVSLPVVVGLHHLCKRFGPAHVLKDLNLTIGQGEVITLIGPSGGGKTTLLRCINMLERLDAGVIDFPFLGSRVDSADKLSPKEWERLGQRIRRSVGMVFQEHNLWLDSSVLHNLTLAPQLVLGMRREQAEHEALELLSRFGLVEKASAWAWQLSGGQRQRVAIIRALILHPRLLLLDEITSALDPILVVDVINLIRELRSDGLAMLIVTHQLNFARTISDRTAFLSGGTIIEVDSPGKILDAPSSTETQRFVSILRESR